MFDKWRKPGKTTQITFRGLAKEPIYLSPGYCSVTFDGWTVFVRKDGVFDFYPRMTPEEIDKRRDGEIRAKYGLLPKTWSDTT